ncbi:MAG: hypothetical protein HC804_00665 [Anaerolineae bacterium]|nr:hypothetical protein [Anaerolineae bacterium]
MAKTKITKLDDVVERNIALVSQVMEYLMAQPYMLESLPEQFEMVILPDDDPEMRLYNLELLDASSDEGKPVVIGPSQI